MSEGDCRAASQQYLEFGIELLGSDCWEEEYGLTLALYNASAEIEYGTANFEHVDPLVSTVLDKAMRFRVTLRVRTARFYSLTSTYHMTEAVAEGLDVLNRLDETFPAEPKKYHVIVEGVPTRRLLRKKTNERILRTRHMTDPDKTDSMQILKLLMASAYLLHFHLVVLAYIFKDYPTPSTYTTGIHETVRHSCLCPRTSCMVTFHSLADVIPREWLQPYTKQSYQVAKSDNSVTLLATRALYSYQYWY